MTISIQERELMHNGIVRPLSQILDTKKEYTWSDKPTAAEFGKGQAWFSDIGVMGYSDGIRWKLPPAYLAANKSYICLGGDHPNRQYLNGLHKIALDRGLPWYMAINTTTGETIPDIEGITLSWEQIKAVQSDGVDIVSHGCGPHINSWRRISSGGFIKYTGNATTASLTISGTFPAMTLATTLAGDQTDGTLGFSLDLTSASYDTCEKVAAYIDALPGWSFIIDPCLKGSEASSSFLAQTATNLKPTTTSITQTGGNATVRFDNHGARYGDSITISGAVPSNYNGTFTINNATTNTLSYPVSGNPVTATTQGKMTYYRPVSAGTGLVLSYTGSAYQHLRVENSTTFKLYGDGVPLCAFNLSVSTYDTLTKLKTQLDALAIAGLLVEICDDKRSAPALTGGTYPYCHGDELSINLEKCYTRELTSGYVRINAGIPCAYLINRRVEESVDTALLHGVSMRHFASSGINLSYQFAPTTTVINETRGNTDLSNTYPNASPMSSLPTGFHYVVEPNASYGVTSAAHMTCLIDALADSPGFLIDLLCHFVLPDGTSGYTLPNIGSTWDLTESELVTLCDRINFYSDKIAALDYTQLSTVKALVPEPKNYLFNPKFRNYGGSLLNLVALTDSANLPGILINTPAHVTAASVNDGVFRIATNATTTFTFLQWIAPLKTRTVYRLSVNVEFHVKVSGTITFVVSSTKNPLSKIYQTGPMTSDQLSTTGRIEFDFELKPDNFTPATIRSKTGTYNVPVGTVKINYSTLPVITGISLAGATPTATTAQEVCNSFNAAMSSAITAGTYTEEWRNFATIENGKVVLSAPYNQKLPQNETMILSADTGADQLTPVFGFTSCTGTGSDSSASKAENFPVNIKLQVQCHGDFSISDPVLRRISNV